MKARHFVVFGVIWLVLFVSLGDIGNSRQAAAPQTDQNMPSRLALISLPLSFEANVGQAGEPADYLARGSDYTLYLEPGAAVIELGGPAADTSSTLRIGLEGADPSAPMTAEERLVGISNYFMGSDPGLWRTNIPHYAKVRTADVYPGIDIVFYGNQAELEFDLEVKPGADPSAIVLTLEGAMGTRVDENGDLVAELGKGEVKLRHPAVYQRSEKGRKEVDASFVLLAEDRIGFDVASYDRAKLLVVDPAIVCATYFGSGGWEMMSKVGVDDAGNIYFAGSTQATNFPTSSALYGTYRGGIFDGFVGKLNPSGTAVLFSTYFGGSGRDTVGSLAVAPDGDIYLAGVTDSMNFPLLAALQGTFGGNGSVGFGDAYLTKMRSDGSALIYSTYLGGSGDDQAMGLGIDAEENAYIMGITESTNFPVANAYQATKAANLDLFISKVNPTGSAFVYSTYLGGSGNETSSGFGDGDIGVNGEGYAAVVGFTDSTNYPVVNAFQSAYGGAGSGYVGDGIVTTLSPTGSVVFSTYLGGNETDNVKAAAVAANGDVVVTGRTKSANFPTHTPYQGTFGGGETDAFVCAFGSDGTIIYSTYLGGSANEEGQDIAVDALGHAYVTGGTQSPNFPTVDPIDGTYSGAGDAYITVMSADGANLAFSTFLGGTGGASGSSIRLDADGNIYLAGGAGAGFPTTAGAVMPNPPVASGGLLLAKIEALTFVAGPTLTSLLPAEAEAGGAGFTLTVYGSDFVDGAVVRWDGSDRSTTFVSGSEVEAAISASDLAAGKTVQITVRNPDTGVSNALPLAINNPIPNLASISPTAVTGGCAAFSLTVLGTNFVSNSVVQWNNVAKTTTFISGTELHAAIDTTCLATPGDVQVTVVNPSPAGGTSMGASLSVAGYTVGSSPTSGTVTAGQSATYTISLTPQYGSFDSAVTFSCAGLPSKCTATFSPTNVTPGAAAATTTLTLATRASASSTAAALSGSAAIIPPASSLALLVLALMLAPRLSYAFGRRVSRRWLAACAIVCLILVIGGCSSGGGDNNPPPYTGTPKGTHTVTVQAVAGNLTVTTPITLVVN